jgi:hypothetical protein
MDSPWKIENRVINQSNEKEWAELERYFTYGSKEAFWVTALKFDLVTPEEFLMAKEFFGTLWTYRYLEN